MAIHQPVPGRFREDGREARETTNDLILRSQHLLHQTEKRLQKGNRQVDRQNRRMIRREAELRAATGA